MKLELLAISDTHLGEDCSLLYFREGRQHLWEVLRKYLAEGGDLEVEEMILMGDIPDRCLSSDNEIIRDTNAFIEMLGSAAHIRKGVYIPGNHDHTIWTEYRRCRYGESEKYGITGPGGDQLVSQGKPDGSQEVEYLLKLFFGYPDGASWRAIEKEKTFDFVFANPLYARQINDRTYVFTHGTHFRRDVTSSAWKKELAHFLKIDKVLGGIEIDASSDIEGNEPMALLETKVARFADSLWQSSHDNPVTQSDKFWYLVTHLGGKFKNKRDIPGDSKLFLGSELLKDDSKLLKADKEQIRKISDDDHSLKLFDKYFHGPMLEHLKASSLPTDKITFVYGDTHDGGCGNAFHMNGINYFRAYNTGGWVAYHKKNHPPCHVFGVKNTGEEFLLDVSFKGVQVEGGYILDQASVQAEHHKIVADTSLSGAWDKLFDNGMNG
jgi:hypothetical protein